MEVINTNIIVLNASQNRKGNSTKIAKQFLQGHSYKQINLVDYKINQIGQSDSNDELNQLINQVKMFDQIVITTPIYWSDMPGYLKTFIDRSGNPASNIFNGIKCFLLIQSTDPSDAIIPVTHVVKHWATRNKMKFMGEATYSNEINLLKRKL